MLGCVTDTASTTVHRLHLHALPGVLDRLKFLCNPLQRLTGQGYRGVHSHRDLHLRCAVSRFSTLQMPRLHSTQDQHNKAHEKRTQDSQLTSTAAALILCRGAL